MPLPTLIKLCRNIVTDIIRKGIVNALSTIISAKNGAKRKTIREATQPSRQLHVNAVDIKVSLIFFFCIIEAPNPASEILITIMIIPDKVAKYPKSVFDKNLDSMANTTNSTTPIKIVTIV